METILDVLHRLTHNKPLDEAEQRLAQGIIDESTHLLAPAEPEPELPFTPAAPEAGDGKPAKAGAADSAK